VWHRRGFLAEHAGRRVQLPVAIRVRGGHLQGSVSNRHAIWFGFDRTIRRRKLTQATAAQLMGILPPDAADARTGRSPSLQEAIAEFRGQFCADAADVMAAVRMAKANHFPLSFSPALASFFAPICSLCPARRSKKVLWQSPR
jgi:hypothetical protein